MKYIISGTNRPESRSLKVSQLIQNIYKELGENVEIISLENVGLGQLEKPQYGEKEKSNRDMAQSIEKINNSEGLIFVVPEYNGSFPGALKYFIDHWDYPASFEHRPVCFVGLGGRFGGLRPVEHLQGVFGYRNAYMFPERVFLTNIWDVLTDNGLEDELTGGLLRKQAEGFQKFVRALKSESLLPPISQ